MVARKQSSCAKLLQISEHFSYQLKLKKTGTKKLQVTSKKQSDKPNHIESTIIVSGVAEVAENYRKLDPVGAEPARTSEHRALAYRRYVSILFNLGEL